MMLNARRRQVSIYGLTANRTALLPGTEAGFALTFTMQIGQGNGYKLASEKNFDSFKLL